MNVQALKEPSTELQCPKCGSQAYYRYGHSRNGKQRYICIICDRQFIPNAERMQMKHKPVCPECGRMMYLYKRELDALRFRCSRYPECRTYAKESIREERG